MDLRQHDVTWTAFPYHTLQTAHPDNGLVDLRCAVNRLLSRQKFLRRVRLLCRYAPVVAPLLLQRASLIYDVRGVLN